MELRAYQQEAVTAVYNHLRNRDDNPCIVIPTAGGKTPILATICRDTVSAWGGRVAVLAHVKELLEQSIEKLHIIAPELWQKIGVYSAGLNCRDTDSSILVAGIQSVYKRACDIGPLNLIIIDEAHLIPVEGDGMYRQFIADMRIINPKVKIIGLTATPFRMKSGSICGQQNILNSICYEIGVRELINQGYLCPLKSKCGKNVVNTDSVAVRGGEFVASDLQKAVDVDFFVRAAVTEIIQYTQNRKSCLIFAAGVEHGEHITSMLNSTGCQCGFITGESNMYDRQDFISQFKSGQLKYLCNVNVLTTGFDATNIDTIALLRPTLSPGLYYQMCGRGFRLHPGKAECLILDYGNNILRHGPVDTIVARDKRKKGDSGPIMKTCPECQSIILGGYSICPDCGYVFPRENLKDINATASDLPVISKTERNEYVVRECIYSVHSKKGADSNHPRTLRVDYVIGFQFSVSEWVCVEHTGYPREKALRWWSQRTPLPMPDNADEAAEIAYSGALTPTIRIVTEKKTNEKWERVVSCTLGEPAANIEEPAPY